MNYLSVPGGNLWFTEVTGNQIGRITPDGAITEFSFLADDRLNGAWR